MFAYKQVILILLRLLMEMGEQKVVTSYMLHMLQYALSRVLTTKMSSNSSYKVQPVLINFHWKNVFLEYFSWQLLPLKEVEHIKLLIFHFLIKDLIKKQFLIAEIEIRTQFPFQFRTCFKKCVYLHVQVNFASICRLVLLNARDVHNVMID